MKGWMWFQTSVKEEKFLHLINSSSSNMCGQPIKKNVWTCFRAMKVHRLKANNIYIYCYNFYIYCYNFIVEKRQNGTFESPLGVASKRSPSSLFTWSL